MSKFKSFLAIIFLVTCHLLVVTSVSAHILEANGPIGAVLHIDPEDDPIAGEIANFFFEFKDKENKFKAENCNCTFKVLQNNNQIYSQDLFQNSQDPDTTNANLTFTFPSKDIYKIQVNGTPKFADAFTPFSLEYDIRVSRESTSTSNQDSEKASFLSTHIIHLAGAVVILIFFVYALLKQKKERGEKH